MPTAPQKIQFFKENIAPKMGRRFYFQWAQGVGLAAMFVVSTVIIFYLGILTGKNIQRRADNVAEKPLARIPTVAPEGEPVRVATVQNVATIAHAGETLNPKAESPTVKTNVGDVPLQGETETKSGAASHAVTTNPVKAVQPPAMPAADAGKSWSVQIAASVEKNTAQKMTERLVAKGYDGYVVQAELSGKTWYRVRVGKLAGRDDAEKLRYLLDSKEGVHGAFVVRE